jgi:uncharacterized repeat protein (TIGR01451 family)
MFRIGLLTKPFMIGDVQVIYPSRWFAFIVSLALMTAVASSALTVNSHHIRPGNTALFTINITNTGETPLNPVEVVDTLPKGMSYLEDDFSPRGSPRGNEIVWPNVGPLGIGDSRSIHVLAKVANNAYGRLTNGVSVTGAPQPEGYNITDYDQEYVDVKKPKSSRNKGLVSIGDQNAVAFGFGRSTNNIGIIIQERS